jgi:hypothetical protein
MNVYKRYTLLIALMASSFLLNAQFIVNSNGIPITNSTTLAVNDSWQNSGPIVNNGTIVTTANWINTGTLTGTGGFILNFAANQNFNAGTNSSTIGFIEKHGVGNVVLSGRVYLNDSLKISGGLIQIPLQSDTLGLSATPLVSVNTGSYVEGPMAKKGGGTFSLPIGRDGNSLPIMFYQVTSARVGAAVEAAAGSFTTGDAVKTLFGFPYVWRTSKANAADTARFIEVVVPNTLLGSLGLDSIIVTRQRNDVNEYEAMGTKSLRPVGGSSTGFKSYDRGLRGEFSLGIGYPGNPVADSIALAQLYAATNGASWTNRSNWVQPGAEVRQWFGVTQKGGRVLQLNLANNNLVGVIPESFTDLQALTTLDLSTNQIEQLPVGLPDMKTLTSVNVSSNSLDFSDLEPIKDLIPTISNQALENQAPITPDADLDAPVNTTLPINVSTSGSGNIYKWKFRPLYDDDPIDDYEDAPGINNGLNYTTQSLTRATIGDYRLDITNSIIPNLIISSGVYTVEATADINGVFSFGSDPVLTSNRPGLFKEMTLLQVTTGGYDTIQQQSVGAAGAFLFSGVKLRDYVISAFADTLRLATYADAVTTWYKDDANNGVIYWEEADTIFLADNINAPGLDIKSGIKPADPNEGGGIISGTFTDPTNTEGGRVSSKNKVSYGVSVRKVQRAGRGTEDITLGPPFAYVYSNEDGQFLIDGLDPRDLEYRLNIQFPGYPMDPDSYIDIILEDNLFGRQVGVDAEVIEGKINVKKLIITGWEEESHSMTAYPNPTVEYLYIKGKPAQSVVFKMYDSNGRILSVNSNWDIQKAQWELDVRNLPTGLYILDVTHAGKTEKLRIAVK